jgi:hypothetical protein
MMRHSAAISRPALRIFCKSVPDLLAKGRRDLHAGFLRKGLQFVTLLLNE